MRHGRPVREVLPEGQIADPGLSEIGVTQAELVAEMLSVRGITHIYSSTMKRALQTAEPLAARLGLEIVALDELRESDDQSNVYVPTEEWTDDDPALAKYQEGDYMDHVFPDGLETFKDRVVPAFEKIIAEHPSQKVVAFCHGMVTLAYLQSLLSSQHPMTMRMDYCGVTRILASREGMRTIRSVNETQHVYHTLAR